MFGFDSKDFLVFPRFAVFCFEMEKTKTLFCLVFWMDMINQDLKKNHVFFAFLFLLLWFDMVSKAKKQKKTAVVFVFFEILVDSMYAKKSKKPTFFGFLFLLLWFDTVSKAKNTWVFCFFEILVGSMHAKKETQCFFLLLKPKKTRENQKKCVLSQNQTFSQKFGFFVFLVLLLFWQDCKINIWCGCVSLHVYINV